MLILNKLLLLLLLTSSYLYPAELSFYEILENLFMNTAQKWALQEIRRIWIL